MKEKTKTMQEMIKPLAGKVLIELIRESNEYTPGISRLNPEIEPYQLVIAVGNEPLVTGSDILIDSREPFVKPGDYIITRNMGKQGYESFKLWGKDYCILYISDIAAVISEEVKNEIKNQLQQTPKEVN